MSNKVALTIFAVTLLCSGMVVMQIYLFPGLSIFLLGAYIGFKLKNIGRQ